MAAKKTKKKSSKKPNALEFCRAYLRKKPKAPFAEIRDAAKKKRIILYPISYGRAKALEGLLKMKPYGSKKKAGKKTKRGPGRPKGSKTKKRGPGRPKGSKNKPKRGPGRPRKSAGAVDLSNLVGLLNDLQRERDGALNVIDKIRDLIG